MAPCDEVDDPTRRCFLEGPRTFAMASYSHDAILSQTRMLMETSDQSKEDADWQEERKLVMDD